MSKQQSDELHDAEHSFVEHLIELRSRLILALIGLLLSMVFLAIWPSPAGLIDWIAEPIRTHMPKEMRLIAVGVFSPFFVPLKVLFMASILLSLPWLMYQLWAFIAPGLYIRERRVALPLICCGCVLCYAGIAFVQFFVLDKMFAFIQAITPDSVNATPDIASYVEAILGLYLAFGLAFQVPIVVMLLVKMKVVSIIVLKSFRGYFIILSFVISAIVTPPDVISQLALAIPMCLLYELGLLGARLLTRNNYDQHNSTNDD